MYFVYNRLLFTCVFVYINSDERSRTNGMLKSEINQIESTGAQQSVLDFINKVW